MVQAYDFTGYNDLGSINGLAGKARFMWNFCICEGIDCRLKETSIWNYYLYFDPAKKVLKI